MVLEKNPVGHSKDCDLTFLNITGLYIWDVSLTDDLYKTL